ncbi:flagellar hook-length control protein FliK [Leisingera sp. ANG-M7]|uniref:flagellar hook-length control protein FliK n=1 Tax=Leisingera sp. ANG-M7 TaxID=1577902 RepID=UPI0009E056FD|nr:flagellar hook-length control protein FliK [Leisingera sp. ANG-M7]
MMMNSILGIEPSAGRKVASTATGNSTKSDGSSDFSNYMTAEPAPSEEAGKVRLPEGESAESEPAERAEAKPVDSAGNEESSSEGEETAGLPAASEASPEIAAPVPEQASTSASGVTELAGQAQAERTASAAQKAESADAIDVASTRGSQPSQEKVTQQAAPFTGEAETETAKSDAQGDAKQVQAGRLAGDSQPADSPKPDMRSETARAQKTERADGNRPPPHDLQSDKGKAAAPGSAAAIPGTVDAQKVTAAESAGSRSQMDVAGQKGIRAPSGGVPVSEAVEGALAAKAVSGKPNEQAVEQMPVRQPEGVTRAVAAGAQGAVQALAAGLSSSRDASRNSELGSVSIKVSEDISAEALAERKPGSATFLTGQVNKVPAVQATPQASIMFQPLLAAGLTETLGESDLPFHALGLSGEAPGLSQLLTEASFGSHSVHRPEMPRLIAAQIAEAFAAKGEQKVEVSLNPQELGHVKMRVVTSETGITMIIQTERPETGDLMRRHINELAEEFRRMGYEDISFEFSGGQAGSGGEGDGSDEGAGQAGGAAGSRTDSAETAGEQTTQNLRLGSAGVDMRV